MTTVPPLEDQEGAIQMLLAVVPSCTETYARQQLVKFNWDIERAAAALLDTALTNEQVQRGRTGSRHEVDEFTGALNAASPPARANSVIDLTKEDEETSKAIAASMETAAVFGPSNRVDAEQQWAMVPSNAPPILSQEDQALNQALEASLNSSFMGVTQERYEEPKDLVARIRKDGRPVALRTFDPSICYVPAVLQCMLSNPAIIDRLLQYDMTVEALDGCHTFSSGLQRLAAAFTDSARSYLRIDDELQSLLPEAPPPMDGKKAVGSLVREFYGAMTDTLESLPRNLEDEASDSTIPLTVFRGGSPEEGVGSTADRCEVVLDLELIHGTQGIDLVSLLTETFAKLKVCVTQVSRCCAFALHRSTVSAIKFPTRLYMDKYLKENMEEAGRLWKTQEELGKETQKLMTDKQRLTNWKDRDTVRTLRSTIHYLQNLALDGGDPARKAAHEQSIKKLESAIKEIEANSQYLGDRAKQLSEESEKLYDRPDLQRHPYDLQAVIMHDGLPGRNHLYTYTKDVNGRWWKTVDYQVTEVTEDVVVNDQTGLHLCAGPLFLFYARADAIEASLPAARNPVWPRVLRELIEEDNEEFLGKLPPEIAALSPYRRIPVSREDSDALMTAA